MTLDVTVATTSNLDAVSPNATQRLVFELAEKAITWSEYGLNGTESTSFMREWNETAGRVHIYLFWNRTAERGGCATLERNLTAVATAFQKNASAMFDAALVNATYGGIVTNVSVITNATVIELLLNPPAPAPAPAPVAPAKTGVFVFDASTISILVGGAVGVAGAVMLVAGGKLYVKQQREVAAAAAKAPVFKRYRAKVRAGGLSACAGCCFVRLGRCANRPTLGDPPTSSRLAHMTRQTVPPWSLQ